jgi:hypothetical protein
VFSREVRGPTRRPSGEPIDADPVIQPQFHRLARMPPLVAHLTLANFDICKCTELSMAENFRFEC